MTSKMLIIDDEVIIRERLINHLELDGYETFVAGAVSTYDGKTPIEEYVKSVAESNEAFFRTVNPGINPPRSVSTGAGPTDWKTIKRQLGKPETAGSAGKAITEYFIKTGKLPPGLE